MNYDKLETEFEQQLKVQIEVILQQKQSLECEPQNQFLNLMFYSQLKPNYKENIKLENVKLELPVQSVYNFTEQTQFLHKNQLLSFIFLMFINYNKMNGDEIINQFKLQQLSIDQELKFSGLQLEDLNQENCGSKNAFTSKVNAVLMARTHQYANKKAMYKEAQELGFKGQIYSQSKQDVKETKILTEEEFNQLNAEAQQAKMKEMKQFMPIFTHNFASWVKFTRLSPFDQVYSQQKKQIDFETLFEYFAIENFNIKAFFETTFQFVQQKAQFLVQFLHVVYQSSFFTQKNSDFIYMLLKSVPFSIPLDYVVKVDELLLQLIDHYACPLLKAQSMAILSYKCSIELIPFQCESDLISNLLQKMQNRFDISVYTNFIQKFQQFEMYFDLEEETMIQLQNKFCELAFEQLFPYFSQLIQNVLCYQPTAKEFLKYSYQLKFFNDSFLQYIHSRTMNIFSFYEQNVQIEQMREKLDQFQQKLQNDSNIIMEMFIKYQKEQKAVQKEQLSIIVENISQVYQSIKSLCESFQCELTLNFDQIWERADKHELFCLEEEVAEPWAILPQDQEELLNCIKLEDLNPEFVYFTQESFNRLLKRNKSEQLVQIALDYNFDLDFALDFAITEENLDQKVQIAQRTGNEKLITQLKKFISKMSFQSITILHSMNVDIKDSQYSDLITQNKFDSIVDTKYIFELFQQQNTNYLEALTHNLKLLKNKPTEIQTVADSIIILLKSINEKIEDIKVQLLKQYINSFKNYLYNKTKREIFMKFNLLIVKNLTKVLQNYCFSSLLEEEFDFLKEILLSILNISVFNNEEIGFFNELFVNLSQGVSTALTKQRTQIIFQILFILIKKNVLASKQLFQQLKKIDQMKFIGLSGVDGEALETLKGWVE